MKLLVLSGLISSFVLQEYTLPNENSWAIGIGKKPLLASWLDNEMGDTLELKRTQLKDSDTLFAQRYLCGQTADNETVVLTVKNAIGETIAESADQDESLMFHADLPVHELLVSPKIKPGDVLAVYFTIKEYDEKEDYTVLLGYLKWK
ncbi:hypothetical protein [Fluviicola sp.]|uniref:hypothetical protein n=1 Tax=Fluviicola sp. TaxID=1917219 RepID=UPI0031CF2DA9